MNIMASGLILILTFAVIFLTYRSLSDRLRSLAALRRLWKMSQGRSLTERQTFRRYRHSGRRFAQYALVATGGVIMGLASLAHMKPDGAGLAWFCLVTSCAVAAALSLALLVLDAIEYEIRVTGIHARLEASAEYPSSRRMK